MVGVEGEPTMAFRIRGLDPAPFQSLFDLDDAALAAHGAVRVVADSNPGYPDRIGLTDAPVGERLILVNYEHQPAETPFRSRYAIYVRRGQAAYDAVDAVPEQLRLRTLSLRGFDARGFLRAAEVVDGKVLEGAAERLLADPGIAYLHAHFAAPGCYAARIERA
jgi:hypothetical protein